MKRLLVFLVSFILLFSACETNKKTEKDVNPLLVEFATPFGVPPFDKIDNEDYLPAYQEAVVQHNAEIEAIVNNEEAASFENTIVAFDRSGQLLRKISPVFEGLRGANTNPRMQEIARETTPLLTSHYNDIRFNQGLFERIKAVYEQRETLNLDLEQMRLTEKVYEDFARNGAALPEAQREELKALNQQMSMISLKLSENLLAENNGFLLVLENQEDLVGLPESVIAAAAEEAKKSGREGKWVITLAKPSWIPFLQFSKRRDLREKIYTAYIKRGDNFNEFDNKTPFLELMELRKKMANLLGYENYAAYFIADQMAQTPGNVYDFLYKVWEPALKRAKSERDELQAIINKENEPFKLAAYDWWYYSEIVRKEKYDLNEDEYKPYFSLDNVRNGSFLLATKLYGLTFEKNNEIPVYHSEVESFVVKNKNNELQGILYIDPHPRPEKRSGAWCGTYRSGSYDTEGKKVVPVVTMVMNFTRPTGETPALLSWDETTTYFHEFGHALHNLFADGKYSRTSRSVPRDFVELPSQIMENWAGEPLLLKEYAFHYKTGEVIPESLVEKMNKSAQFNQGFDNVEYLSASILDLDWHTIPLATDTDANAFEKATLMRIGMIDEIVPRYRTPNFGHIFGTGYAAGYYVYRWAGVLDADAFDAYKESGDMFNPELAEKFRKYVLAENALYEGMDAYVKFRGKEPSIDPFLIRSGLK